MVRAPCCEKMGLKKGPWTPEEDDILVSHIQRFGHSNWRALPKQAGLLRCGKSCRLRWINYLRPDIKRGNFSTEEEDTIIKLHQLLGNRWSAIAAKLPGRTDNEIKNVWHTHLKKRLLPKAKDHASHQIQNSNNIKIEAKSINRKQDFGLRPVSPTQSASEFSSSVTETSTASALTEENTDSYGTSLVKHESFTSEEFPIIDESFWSEDLSSMDHNGNEFNDHVAPVDTSYGMLISDPEAVFGSSNADDMDFWLRVFMEAGDMKELPQL